MAKKKDQTNQTDMFFRSVPIQVRGRITRYRKENRITLSGFLERAIDTLESIEKAEGADRLAAVRRKLDLTDQRLQVYERVKKVSQEISGIEDSVQIGELGLQASQMRRMLLDLQNMKAELVAEMEAMLPKEAINEIAAVESVSPSDSDGQEENQEESEKGLDEVFGPLPKFTPEELEGETGDNDLGEVDETTIENTSPPVTENDVKPDPFLFGDEEDLAGQIEKVIGGSEKEQDPINTVSESTQDSGPMLLGENVTPERKAKVEKVRKELRKSLEENGSD